MTSTATTHASRSTTQARRGTLSLVSVAGICILAVVIFTVVQLRTNHPVDGQRVRVVLSSSPELRCEVDPGTVQAGLRHVDVIHDVDTGPVLVQLLKDTGTVVFSYEVNRTANGERPLPVQEMAKLTPGGYVVECVTAAGHVRSPLAVVND